VYINKSMQFITEAEHVHTSSEQMLEQFHTLAMRLGMESDGDCDLAC